MKKITPIIRNLKKYRKNANFKAKFTFTKYYEKLEIKEDQVLFESFNGANFNGCPYYIFLELCKEPYQHLKKYVAVNKNNIEDVEAMLNSKGLMDSIEIVERHSKQYCKLLAESKYLVNNVTFPTYFIKKEGQVYLNTWHGTPLKTLGRSIQNNPHAIGNVQRNFFMSDYLLFPNKYTFDHMREDYMLNQFFTGEYILSDYPCNNVFFSNEKKNEMKKELDLENKKIVVYMPTWRDKIADKKHNKQIFYTFHLLFELEKRLPEDTYVFVKLHHLGQAKIQFDDFEKIRPFPVEYEPYEILNMADVLITDYSSVMFDFACTGKKIILYTYDKDEYMNGRSMYTSIDKLPFINTDSIEKICDEIAHVESYPSYKEQMKDFCFYHTENVTQNLCNYFINSKKSSNLEVIKANKYYNNKKNILIFGGQFIRNGITTALTGILNNIDLDENNYILTFYQKKVGDNKDFLNSLDRRITYFPMFGQKNMTISESIAHYFYFRWNLNTKFIRNKLSNIYKREIKRLYPNIQFDMVIHYTGYERQIMHLFGQMDAKKIIYTHSNLLKERKTRNNIHFPSLKFCYDNYDKIVVIKKGMEKEIKSHYKKIDEKKIYVAHNLNNIEKIKRMSLEPVCFDENTFCNIELDELKEILENKKVTKFINVARFSKEKGLDRLIRAFSKNSKNYPDTYLIIIGSHGNQFDNIMKLIEEEEIEHVIIIQSLSNPYAILKQCDAFILSSYYEGLPMVIMEAFILKKDVMSTSINGLDNYIKDYALILENSEDGLLKGFEMYSAKKFPKKKEFNAEEFNKNALKEFYDIIKKWKDG